MKPSDLNWKTDEQVSGVV